ncbi:hypothetical protein RDWZM_006253 [Blomia tropicalis]|uniref:Uncharacterized protein n=1 Tax=Blomia tropicalis TaxID=40697 RepID=A0A9Q0M6R4_BLOTA|nr:hypothetical protein RDWZM_006253 [Blomia tropicalis]
MDKTNDYKNNLKNGHFKVSQIVDSSTYSSKFNNCNADRFNNEHQATISNRKQSIITDLIPYPSSSISTTIERALDISDLNQAQLNGSEIISLKSIVNVDKLKEHGQNPSPKCEKLKLSSTMLPISSSSQNQQQSIPKMKIPFDNEQIVRVVKFLKERKECATQTAQREYCNQYVQANVALESNIKEQKIDLNRSNQTLRNQLDQLSYVIEQMSKERSSTHLQLHSLQKLITVKELKIEETKAENEKYLADNDELRFTIKNIEKLINDYQRNLTIKSTENDELRVELNQMSTDKNNLSSQLEQMQKELLTKNNLIQELNKINEANQVELISLRNNLQTFGRQISKANIEVETLEQQLIPDKNAKISSVQIMNRNHCRIINKQKIVCLLSEESAKTTVDTEQYQQQLKNAHDELNGARSQIRELSQQCFDLDHLRNENDGLRKMVTLLNEDKSLLKCRVDELNVLANETAQNRTQLDNIETQLQKSSAELIQERKAKQLLMDERNQFEIELNNRRDKIVNLESNIQMITKRYRELSQQINNKRMCDQYCQVDHETTSPSILIDLQNVLIQRETQINNQNELLAQLKVENDRNKKLKEEMQIQLELLEQKINEKDETLRMYDEMPSKEISTQLNELQNDLIHERERSKGLGQSLFNEKRMNIKLKKEIERIQNQNETKIIGSELEKDLDEFDHETLNSELKKNVENLKLLLGEIDKRRKLNSNHATSSVENSTNSISNCSNSLKETLANLSGDQYGNDFIIQMLDFDQENMNDTETNSK